MTCNCLIMLSEKYISSNIGSISSKRLSNYEIEFGQNDKTSESGNLAKNQLIY